jgi:hypothetical protein
MELTNLPPWTEGAYEKAVSHGEHLVSMSIHTPREQEHTIIPITYLTKLFIAAEYNSSTLCSKIFDTLDSRKCRMLCKLTHGLSHMMPSRLDIIIYKNPKCIALQFLQQMYLAAFAQILKGIIILTVHMPCKHITFQRQTVLKFLMRREDIHCV